MVNQEKAKKWNLKEFGFESKDGVVTKMFCKVCKEYYSGCMHDISSWSIAIC